MRQAGSRPSALAGMDFSQRAASFPGPELGAMGKSLAPFFNVKIASAIFILYTCVSMRIMCFFEENTSRPGCCRSPVRAASGIRDT